MRSLGFLLAVYLCVSVVAYLDLPRDEPVIVLDDSSRRGLEVWRARGCQACHPIHGFGGFLGPDLTNRVTDETPDEEFEWILREGSGRMPAFDLDERDRGDVLSYLRAVDRTGRAVPPGLRASRAPDRRTYLEDIVSRAHPPGSVRRGAAAWTRLGCGACHVPFTTGRLLAPDATARAARRSWEGLGELLESGRGRMPSFPGVPGEDVRDVAACLEWAAGHRAELQAIDAQWTGREGFSWDDVPWFEYP